MLSADFGHLDRDTRMIDKSAAQWIHIDVMDGVFVPNISFGFPVLKFIRQATTKPLDVHLMIVEPERYVKRFAEAGSDIVTFHYEATNAAPTKFTPQGRGPASRSSRPPRSKCCATCCRRSTWCS